MSELDELRRKRMAELQQQAGNQQQAMQQQMQQQQMQQEMEKALDVPVYDVKKIAVGYWLTRLTDFRSDG